MFDFIKRWWKKQKRKWRKYQLTLKYYNANEYKFKRLYRGDSPVFTTKGLTMCISEEELAERQLQQEEKVSEKNRS